MTLHPHVQDSVPGVVGTTTAGGLTILGFITESLPFLQAFSLLAGIAVAIVTFIYYWRKIRAESIKAEAKVAADVVQATAKVVAAALEVDDLKNG